MNNDDLKKKIIDIIHDAEMCSAKNNCDTCKYGQELMKYKDMSCRTLKAADALIAAGIGDVKEAEHRAEVAELVVKNLNDIFTFDYQTVFEQAEKELEEERNVKN